jgi:phytoene dehydrogenase-like protein
MSWREIFECNHEEAGYAITNYSMLDPGSAPEGKNVITLTAYMPFECHQEWGWLTSRKAYLLQREQVADVLLERAEEHLPDLRSYIEYKEIGTPQTVRTFTLNPRGSIFGWESSIEQSMLKRLPQQTPIPNLLLAGAWTSPGGGQSAVLISGNMAGNTILERMGAEEDRVASTAPWSRFCRCRAFELYLTLDRGVTFPGEPNDRFEVNSRMLAPVEPLLDAATAVSRQATG